MSTSEHKLYNWLKLNDSHSNINHSSQAYSGLTFAIIMIMFLQVLFKMFTLMCLSFYRDNFPNERIPCLDEVVDLCISLGLQMYIDVKAATQSGRVS